MLEGMHHLHKHAGYLIFGLLFLQLVVAIAGGGKKEGTRRVLDILQTVSVRIVGPVILLAGIYLWHALGYPLTTWWLGVSLLLWAPMEIVGKRMIRPALEESGASEGNRLVLGATLQLGIISAIIGVMSANAVLG
jgi:hypothetical protein